MKTIHNRKAAKILNAFAQERSIRDLEQEKKVLEKRVDKANEFIQKTQQIFYTTSDIHFIMDEKGLPKILTRYALNRTKPNLIKF